MLNFCMCKNFLITKTFFFLLEATDVASIKTSTCKNLSFFKLFIFLYIYFLLFSECAFFVKYSTKINSECHLRLFLSYSAFLKCSLLLLLLFLSVVCYCFFFFLWTFCIFRTFINTVLSRLPCVHLLTNLFKVQ